MERLARAVQGLVRGLQPVDYLALYPSKVHSQAADGTLQVFPDSPKIPKMAGVRLRTPFPQCKVTVEHGTRVLLGFEAGDPSLPYCSLWDSTTGNVTLVSLGAEGSAQFVALANLVDARISAIQTAYDAHVHPTGVGPSGVTTPLGTQASVAATKLKTE